MTREMLIDLDNLNMRITLLILEGVGDDSADSVWDLAFPHELEGSRGEYHATVASAALSDVAVHILVTGS